jgi:hypothetical protein
MARGTLKANNQLHPEVELRPGGKAYRPIVDTFWSDQTTAALQLPFLQAIGNSSSLVSCGALGRNDFTHCGILPGDNFKHISKYPDT